MITGIAPDWCRRFLRIPYLDRGRTHVGVDCYGLVAMVNREQFGRVVPDYAYASSMDQNAVAQTIAKFLPCDWRRVDVPEPGDLVMLKILGRPWHCGVYVAPGLMLHAIDHAVSGIDRLDSPRWARRVVGYYRSFAIAQTQVAA
jgi:cell wall-associated NlpC family hydrolase